MPLKMLGGFYSIESLCEVIITFQFLDLGKPLHEKYSRRIFTVQASISVVIKR